MSHITYYLGAGASANALPLYSNFKIRLEVFRDFIFHFVNKDNAKFVEKSALYLRALNELILNLEDTESSTLDALANELYLRTSNSSFLDFDKLKYLISDFFVFEQLQKTFPKYRMQIKDDLSSEYKEYDSKIVTQTNTHIDKRYRSFITSELDGARFPEKINFISWNYDIQLELGYRRIRNCSLDSAQADLQVFPSPNCINGIDIDKSSVIKLNGTAGIYHSLKQNKAPYLENFMGNDCKFDESYINYMIEIFYNNSSRIFGGYPFFTFSFEKETKDFINRAIEYANKIIKRTSTLIVIGYSFHPLNREVDKKVFQNLDNLRNVIIQVPSETDFNKVKYNFKKIAPGVPNIKPHYFVEDFHASNNI